jgi:hypothetical protein
MKILLVGAELSHSDRHNEANCYFSQFREGAIKYWYQCMHTEQKVPDNSEVYRSL